MHLIVITSGHMECLCLYVALRGLLLYYFLWAAVVVISCSWSRLETLDLWSYIRCGNTFGLGQDIFCCFIWFYCLIWLHYFTRLQCFIWLCCSGQTGISCDPRQFGIVSADLKQSSLYITYADTEKISFSKIGNGVDIA